MKKFFGFVVPGIAAGLIALSGCGLDQTPPYSPGVKYGVRQDPLVVGQAAKLAADRWEPDRPGVLPILNLQQALEPNHPYQAKLREALAGPLDTLIDGSGKKSADLPPSERITLQGNFLKDPKNRASFDSTLDTLLRDPTKLSDKDRAELEAALETLFGTPAKPTIAVPKIDDFLADAELAAIENGDDNVKGNAEKALEEYKKTIDDLKLDDKTLSEGSRRYRIHCLHCHGVPGDGRGPTARWINPHPRDFRQGLFKFQSVNQASDGKQRPPSRADLMRTLRQGIEGTAMPSFNLLADHELESIVSYVIHLSIRGRAEYDTIKGDFDYDKDKGALKWKEGETPKTKARALGVSARNFVLKGWKQANESAYAIKPADYPYKDGDLAQLKASVERGQQLFLGDEKHPRGKAANCKQCHDDYGRQAMFKVDDWGTLVRPNNFTQGIFRGGRRPIDMYYRIHSGINGSGMNNFGGVLKGEDIWDLVNFVSTASHAPMLKQLNVSLDHKKN